ncbi:unnamed protein product, partial [Meganyctiphanes norvegica]
MIQINCWLHIMLLHIMSVKQNRDPFLLFVLELRRDLFKGGGHLYNFFRYKGMNVNLGGLQPNVLDNSNSIYRYILPDGQPAEFEWYADEFGFHIVSDLLPIAPVLIYPPPWGPNAWKQVLHAQAQKDLGLIYHGETNTWRKKDSSMP